MRPNFFNDFLGVKIRCKKVFGSQNFGVKNFLVPSLLKVIKFLGKHFLRSQTYLGTKFFFRQKRLFVTWKKILGQKKFWGKKVWVNEYFFLPKVQKNFWVQTFWNRRIFGSEKFGSQKNV